MHFFRFQRGSLNSGYRHAMGKTCFVYLLDFEVYRRCRDLYLPNILAKALTYINIFLMTKLTEANLVNIRNCPPIYNSQDKTLIYQ